MSIHTYIPTTYALFRNKRFMLDEMFQRNASKFAIFLEYENHCILLLTYVTTFKSKKVSRNVTAAVLNKEYRGS